MNKLTKLGLGLVVIIVLIFVGAAVFKKPKQATTNNFITYKDNHLTDANKEIYNKKLQELSVQINNSTSNDEKFNLYMQQGFNYYGLGQLADAKASYLKAIEAKSNDYTAYVALYQDEVDMGDYQGALDNIKKAIDLSPKNPDLWRKYIQFESDILKVDDGQVKDLYIQALNKTNGSIDIITVYAQFLEKTSDFQGAKDQWQKAIAAFPANKKIYQDEIDRINQEISKQ